MGNARRLVGVALVVAITLSAALWEYAPTSPASLAGWLDGPRAFAERQPAFAAVLYVLFYVAFAALSLPGIWVVSVGGGALFGPWAGPPLVCVAYTAGAILAMTMARYLLRDAVAARIPAFVARVDRGVAGGGARWLFAARLTPVVPYFAINLAAGLTKMRTTTFALVTFVGALPFACLYTTLGAGLTRGSGDVGGLDGKAVAALLALGVTPLAWGFVARRLRVGASQHERPQRFRRR